MRKKGLSRRHHQYPLLMKLSSIGLISFLLAMSWSICFIDEGKAGYIAKQSEVQQLEITAPSQVLELTTFSVVITALGAPVENVAVTTSFNNQILYTNSEGIVTFTSPDVETDTYIDITATKVGYLQATASILVCTPPQLNIIADLGPVMYVGSSYSIYIKDEHDTAVQNANVNFNSQNISTDSDGAVLIDAPSVTEDTPFVMTATKDGYLPASLEFQVLVAPPPSGGGDCLVLVLPQPDINIIEQDDLNIIINPVQMPLIPLFGPPLSYVLGPSGSSSLVEEPEDTSLPIQTTFHITINRRQVSQITIETTTPFTSVVAILQNRPYLTSPNERIGDKLIFNTYDFLLIGDNRVLTPDDIKSMTVFLKIDKTWIQDNSIETDSLQLIPTIGNIFSPSVFPNPDSSSLTLIKDTEDDQYIYCHVESPEYLATFTIVGTQFVEVHPYQSNTPEISWAFIIGAIIAASIALVVVLFKAGYIYRLNEQPNEEVAKVQSVENTPVKIIPNEQITTILPVIFKPIPGRVAVAETMEPTDESDSTRPPLYY